MKTNLKLLLLFLAFAPFVDAEGLTYARYGQKLEDDALAGRPQVVALSIIAKPSAGGEATEIRSTTKSSRPAIAGQELRLSLGSVSGAEAGVLDVTFSPRRSLSAERRRVIAEAIEKQISARIWDSDSLFETFPFDTTVPYRTNAQQLVETTLDRHPGLLVLCLHLTPPGQQKSITFACNVGRIGWPDDDGDQAVIKSGQPGSRRDAGRQDGEDRDRRSMIGRGSTIGAFSVFFFPTSLARPTWR